MNSPDLPPRRGFNDLPSELKAEIVALAAEQDEAFKVWAGKHYVPKETAQGTLFGKSVSALFRVNKELSMLSAPFLFKVRRLLQVEPSNSLHSSSSFSRRLPNLPVFS
jgi:hypothetical protein